MSGGAADDPWAGAPRLVLRVRCAGSDHLLEWERGSLVAPAHDVQAELSLAALSDGARPACIEIVAAWDAAIQHGTRPPRVLDRIADHLHGVSPGPTVEVLDIDIEGWAARRRAELRLATPRFGSARSAGRSPGRSPTPDELAVRVQANERAVFLRGLLLLLPHPFLGALAAEAVLAQPGTVGQGDVERLVAECFVRSGVGVRVRCGPGDDPPRLLHGTAIVAVRWLLDVWFKGAAIVGGQPCLALDVAPDGRTGRAVLLREERRLLLRHPELVEVAVASDDRGAWWVAGP